jgi:RNA polymerase sigma factor (sigma-70 family)
MARMSSLPDAEHAATDADAGLLLRLAAGDREAIDELYRRHEEYARRVATAVSGGDPVVADDLMAEAFAAVFRRAGSNAPILNFRAYLGACIRNAYLAHRRDGARSVPASDQPWVFDNAVDAPDLVDGVAAEHAIAALAALPAGWRELLWRVEVEGRTNAELAALMGKSHTAVSSMTHRAREGLRRAFLDRHVPTSDASACRWTRQQLSKYVRSELSDRGAGRVRTHVSECAKCAGVLQDLESVNRRIGLALWPVLLVGAGPTLPILAGVDGSSSTTPPDASSGPLSALTGASPTVIATVVATVAAAVVAAGALAMNLVGTESEPGDKRPAAVAPGAASGLDVPPPANKPPGGPIGRPGAALPATVADEKANKEAADEEEDEDSTEPPPRPAPPTPTPPPLYDASIGSVDKSSVSPGDTAFQQSLTFVAQMNATGPRTGVVLDLAISFDQQISVEQFSGSGWDCRIQPNGENLEDYLGDAYVFDPGTGFTCSYEFPDENAPPPLHWDVEFAEADGVTGSAEVSVVGKNDPATGNNEESF